MSNYFTILYVKYFLMNLSICILCIYSRFAGRCGRWSRRKIPYIIMVFMYHKKSGWHLTCANHFAWFASIPLFLSAFGKEKIPELLWNSGDLHRLAFIKSGATTNRTRDTRIFSPLLFYGIRKLADAHFWMQPTELWHFMTFGCNQLSYGTLWISRVTRITRNLIVYSP